MPETFDLELIPISTYLFQLPNTPDGEDIEVTISFFRDTKHNVVAEAWLHPNKCKLKQLWADIYKFEDYDELSDEEILNKVIPIFNESETFNDSVQAVLDNNWEYFELDEEAG